MLGIAARVFGVDISPLSERMGEVTSFAPPPQPPIIITTNTGLGPNLSPFVAELLLHDACPYVPRLTAFSRC